MWRTFNQQNHPLGIIYYLAAVHSFGEQLVLQSLVQTEHSNIVGEHTSCCGNQTMQPFKIPNSNAENFYDMGLGL